MMNRKDIEAYQKSYEGIDIFFETVSAFERYCIRRIEDKIK